MADTRPSSLYKLQKYSHTLHEVNHDDTRKINRYLLDSQGLKSPRTVQNRGVELACTSDETDDDEKISCFRPAQPFQKYS